MSTGGLLQKALEQQENNDNSSDVQVSSGILEDAVIPKSTNNDVISIQKIIAALGIGGLLPIIIIMWFGIYIIPDTFPITAILPLVSVISFIVVWIFLGIGTPVSFGGPGVKVFPAVIVATSYLSMILLPIILGSVLVGDMSIGDIEITDDGNNLEIKIRQNGGSSSPVDAGIMIGTWSQTMELKIDKSDGYGDYGKLIITISDFYVGNALPSTDYIMEITVNGISMSATLDSNHLSRTIDDVQGQTSPVISESSDDCGSYDNCVIGVSLVSWSGLKSNSRPASLPLADYNLSAALYYEDGKIAIDYPDVSVTGSPLNPFAQAEWNSNSGEFGSGNYVIGDFGSELPLEGSTNHPDFSEIKYVPKDQWEESEHGCYYFVVEVTQNSAWTDQLVVTDTSYYNYVLETAPGNGGGTTESWSVSTDPCETD